MAEPMKDGTKFFIQILVIALVLFGCLTVVPPGNESVRSVERAAPISDHFDGTHFFNPSSWSNAGQEPRGAGSRWFWRWLFGNDWPEWPRIDDMPLGPPPPSLVPKHTLRVTPVGHSTFLIQIDGVNILTDPIWSQRCSPVSWAGPKRHRRPGIPFEDLPLIDAVLISHNHYDHLDLPTLRRLAKKSTPRAIVPHGNFDVVKATGIPEVNELDWWESVRLSPDVIITFVPARHFSSRTLWDRNKTLWGGFVVSGAWGTVYYSGDTGYGPHFREIARRFKPIKVALLPISPFRPSQAEEKSLRNTSWVHIGPAEAVQAHLDLGTQISLAAHFQVFQLGPDGFDDAVKGLVSALRRHSLNSNAFLAPPPGQTPDLDGLTAGSSDSLKVPAVAVR